MERGTTSAREIDKKDLKLIIRLASVFIREVNRMNGMLLPSL
jgi:hypothetical protein